MHAIYTLKRVGLGRDEGRGRLGQGGGGEKGVGGGGEGVKQRLQLRSKSNIGGFNVKVSGIN